MTNFEDVGAFHSKFGLHNVNDAGSGPTFAMNSYELMEFRRKFLHEELEEFETGLEEGDIAQVADALVDLVYVALGTAHLLGLPWEELWADVQRANMSKERAAGDGSNSKRGSSFDVIKPEGWVPPKTVEILAAAGHGVPVYKEAVL